MCRSLHFIIACAGLIAFASHLDLSSGAAASCVACAKGTFANTSSSLCKGCNHTGQCSGLNNCSKCPAGSYQNESGKTTCMLCSPGYKSSKPGSEKCDACLPGYYQSKEGAKTCLACQPGYYSSKPGSEKCDACLPGYYQPKKGAKTCSVCQPGYYSSSSNSTKCETCLPGTFSNSTRAVKCLPCVKGGAVGFVVNLSRNQVKEMTSNTESDTSMDRNDNESGDEMSTSEQSASEAESVAADEINPWIPLIKEPNKKVMNSEELMQKYIRDGTDDETAREKPYTRVLPKMQKEFEHVYLDCLLWMKGLKRDPVHRKIVETRDAFINDDGFDREEALEAAIDKRKFLIRRLLKQNTFDDNEDNANPSYTF